MGSCDLLYCVLRCSSIVLELRWELRAELREVEGLIGNRERIVNQSFNLKPSPSNLELASVVVESIH